MKQLVRLSAIVALLFAVGVLAACPRADPERRASQALQDANLGDVNLQWEDDERILRLSGTVQTQEERQRAEQIATQAVGTTGRVVNELEVEAEATEAMDWQLRDRLTEMRDEDEAWREQDIDFDVHAGVVTIMGEVETEEQRQQIEQRVRQMPGVHDVVNNLEVRDQEPAGR